MNSEPIRKIDGTVSSDDAGAGNHLRFPAQRPSHDRIVHPHQRPGDGVLFFRPGSCPTQNADNFSATTAV